LAIQKRSSEVWTILGSVKKEFGSFQEVLEKTQKHVRQVDEDLEKLIGTRTRQINRSLSKVEIMDRPAGDTLTAETDENIL
jgi:DNA recombination protein RmuC